jgi:hypothetical protein
VPESIEVYVGDILDLYCSATSPDGSALSYLWYQTSTGKLEDIIAINRGSETTDTLRVDTSTPGTYYFVCGVDTANGGGAYSSVIRVTVMEKSTVLRGDVNLDGVVDMKDAAMLQRHVLKIDIITDERSLAAAQLTDDEIVDMKDAAKLTRFVIKVIDSLD